MMMKMEMMWGVNVTFLFQGLKTDSSSAALYYLGLFLTFLFGLGIELLMGMKSRVMSPAKRNKAALGSLEAVSYFCQAISMLFYMTYNWGVLIAIVVGRALGTFISTFWMEKKAEGFPTPARKGSDEQQMNGRK